MKIHLPKLIPQVTIVSVVALLLAGGAYPYLSTQKAPAKATPTTAESQQQEKTQSALAITSSAPESAEAALNPVASVESDAQTLGNGLQILASVPRSSFPMGEDSGVVTVSTSDGSAVAWNIWAPDQSITISYVNKGPQFSGTSTVSFKVKNNPYIKAKTYILNIEAIRYGTTPKVRIASKVLTFTVTQEPDPLTMNAYYAGYIYADNSRCINHPVWAKNPTNYLVLEQDIKVDVRIVSGDPNNISLQTTPSRTCLTPNPGTPAGERTFRITATHEGNTVSRDVTISLGSY